MPGQYWAASPWTASVPLIVREGPQMKDGHPSSAIHNIRVNKTPISANSNREIGGVAPSIYLDKLEKKQSTSPEQLNSCVESHWINHTLLRADDFDHFIIDRAARLLSAIESATGRTIAGKDSEDVIQAFGRPLILQSATNNQSAN